MLEIGLPDVCLEALTSWSNHGGAGKMKETQVILGFQGNKRAYRSRIKQTLPARDLHGCEISRLPGGSFWKTAVWGGAWQRREGSRLMEGVEAGGLGAFQDSFTITVI